MKSHCFLSLIASMTLLAGCPVTSIPPSLPSSRTLSEPVPEQAAGPYVHAPSKVTFPEVVAGFTRDRILSEGAAVLHNPAERAGLRALFSFTDVFAHIRQPVLSELDVFILEKAWFVKYRATYPEACAAAMSSRVSAFMAALAWPDGA